MREHIGHERKLTLKHITLLKIGRPFRIYEDKVIVGRNEDENKRLMTIAKSQGLSWLETIDYNGPITLLIGKEKLSALEIAPGITARYSDAPKRNIVKVAYKGKQEKTVEIKPLTEKKLKDFRI